MSVSVNVGLLAQLCEFDPESAEHLEAEIAILNELLAKNCLPRHDEPRQRVSTATSRGLCGFPYSYLHRLRRVYARLAADPRWRVTPGDDGAADDPAIAAELERMRCHLICHSDCEGFYVPVAFENPLLDDSGQLPGQVAGSSYRLFDELVAIAPALGIRLDDCRLADEQVAKIDADADGPLSVERSVWLSLYEAARLSIEHKMLIVFN